MRVVWSRRADKELLAIHDWIADRDPKAAERFIEAAIASTEVVARFPRIGSARPSRDAGTHGIYAWPIKGFEQYVINYRLTRQTVHVARVLHGATPTVVLRTPE